MALLLLLLLLEDEAGWNVTGGLVEKAMVMVVVVVVVARRSRSDIVGSLILLLYILFLEMNSIICKILWICKNNCLQCLLVRLVCFYFKNKIVCNVFGCNRALKLKYTQQRI